jgi:stage III sporulation protein AH
MNLIIKRRQLILATLIVALGAAVFVNWYYTGGDNMSATGDTTGEYVQNLGEAKYVNATGENNDYFAEAKLQRDKTNAEALEKLNDSLKNATAGTEEAEAISTSINELTSQIKTEKDLETLITGKLNCESLVIIKGDSAQIVVEKGVLNDTSALQIMDTVTSNTDLDPTKVSISETK